MEGWIKLHRQFTKWERYDDINTKVLFIHLLCKTQFEDYNYRWDVIPVWYLKTWRKLLSQETWLSEQQIRTSLNKLKSTNEITIFPHSLYSLIKVNKWKDYQQATSNSPNNQPQSNHEVTTNKNTIRKEEKKLSYWNFVKLKKSEYNNLVSDYWENIISSKIEDINNYCASSWKKYKDFSAVIRSWIKKDKIQKKSEECFISPLQGKIQRKEFDDNYRM